MFFLSAQKYDISVIKIIVNATLSSSVTQKIFYTTMAVQISTCIKYNVYGDALLRRYFRW